MLEAAIHPVRGHFVRFFLAFARPAGPAMSGVVGPGMALLEGGRGRHYHNGRVRSCRRGGDMQPGIALVDILIAFGTGMVLPDDARDG